MTQDTVSPEARTVNTLVLDTETGTLNPDAGFAGVPLANIVNSLVKGNKTTKTPALIPEADPSEVRKTNGENSVNGWDITITNNLSGAVVNSTGITEISASTTQPQHKGVSATQILHHLGAMAGCPQNAKFVNTLIDALVLEQSGASKDDVAQHYSDNKINWSPSTEAKNTLLKTVRKTTMATTAGKILITRD
jgi:hypothetical protein